MSPSSLPFSRFLSPFFFFALPLSAPLPILLTLSLLCYPPLVLSSNRLSKFPPLNNVCIGVDFLFIFLCMHPPEWPLTLVQFDDHRRTYWQVCRGVNRCVSLSRSHSLSPCVCVRRHTVIYSLQVWHPLRKPLCTGVRFDKDVKKPAVCPLFFFIITHSSSMTGCVSHQRLCSPLITS